MYVTELIIFKPGSLEKIEKYANNDGYDESFIESKYEINYPIETSYDWKENLGECIKMDWGSYLYICDREIILRMFEITNIKKLYNVVVYDNDMHIIKKADEIFVSELPSWEKYGILQIEI